MAVSLQKPQATLKLREAGQISWDVLVIGAGPSGSMAAREAARSGSRVLLVDRAVFPRGKVCGCCLNGAALKILSDVGLGGIPEKCGAPILNAIHLSCRDRVARVPLPQSVSVVAETLGCRIGISRDIVRGRVFGWHASVNRRVGHRWTPGRTQNRGRDENGFSGRCHHCRRVRCPFSCPTRNGRTPDCHHLTDRCGCRIVSCSRLGSATGVIYMACDRDGYVGLVRLEDGQLDVAAALDGAAVKRIGGIGPLVGRILHDSNIPVSDGIDEVDWQGTAKLTQNRRKVFGDRYFIVGDTAGYVEPFTGRGYCLGTSDRQSRRTIRARFVGIRYGNNGAYLGAKTA